MDTLNIILISYVGGLLMTWLMAQIIFKIAKRISKNC